MSRKNIVLAVIVIGIVVVAIVTKSKPAENSKQVVQNQENTSFEDFIKNGRGAYVCNVEQKVSNFESKGVVYIQNGEDMASRKINGEFKTTAQGMNVTTNFIMRDGFSYTWSSMLPNTGFKVKIEEPKTGDTSTQTSGTYGFDTKQIGSYDCKDWSIDESKFAIPTSVKFIEQQTPSNQQGV